MSDYVILPDVTCDLSEEIRKEYGLDDYVMGHVSMGEGRDYYSKLDWSDISRDEFYKIVSGRNAKVTTAPPNTEEYFAAFEKYVSKGIKVLSMSLSSRISSTYDFSTVAAKNVKEKYPDAEIYCFDSFRMSGAFGLLVMNACRLKNEGKSFEETIAWLEENKKKVHQMGPIDDLIFVARHGRITMGKAIMGSFAGVKPMGDCNSDGYTTVLTKAKGIKKAFDITAKYISASAKDVKEQTLLIAHSDREEYANDLKAILEKEVQPKKILITDVFDGCGPNIGPGMIGVYYLGDEISGDLSKEKEIMSGVTGK